MERLGKMHNPNAAGGGEAKGKASAGGASGSGAATSSLAGRVLPDSVYERARNLFDEVLTPAIAEHGSMESAVLLRLTSLSKQLMEIVAKEECGVWNGLSRMPEEAAESSRKALCELCELVNAPESISAHEMISSDITGTLFAFLTVKSDISDTRSSTDADVDATALGLGEDATPLPSVCEKEASRLRRQHPARAPRGRDGLMANFGTPLAHL